MLKLTIDGLTVEALEGETVLLAAKRAGIDIPTLCYLKEINEVAACRICLVEIEGQRNLQPACTFPVSQGLVVKTNSKLLRKVRQNTLKLLIANHNRDCLVCSRNKNCELQSLAQELQVDNIPFESNKTKITFDDKSTGVVRDTSKCIQCGRCISTCRDVQKIGVLDFSGRGIDTEVVTAFNRSIVDTECISCGQCIVACPVAALKEKEDIDKVWDALEDKDSHVIVQTAPAVRAALGEEFGFEMGTRVTGKMVSALKLLGFDKVFDTNFAADLTIMEEGYEFLARLEKQEKLPLITSCSPGWINYCETNYPQFIENLSTCKSPQQMFGAIVKSYYAKNNNIDPKKIFVVSVMPCTAKKGEAAREQNKVDGLRDVDAVITTRELAKMIKEAGIDFNKLEDDSFDDPLGEYTGAATLFGVTGGVMEAALRTVTDVIEGKDMDEIEYKMVRGFEGIKEAQLNIAGKQINIAVAHGIANAKRVLSQVANGEKEYHFIEIMGCSGGCINGGGQPHVPAKDKIEKDIRALRAKALYEEDTIQKVRKSHKNQAIQKLYQDFLVKPNSEKAHALLHTHYNAKRKDS